MRCGQNSVRPLTAGECRRSLATMVLWKTSTLRGNIVVRLDIQRVAVQVVKQVVVDGDIAFRLQQGFAGIVGENVAVDPVTVLAADAAERPVAEQQITAPAAPPSCCRPMLKRLWRMMCGPVRSACHPAAAAASDVICRS